MNKTKREQLDKAFGITEGSYAKQLAELDNVKGEINPEYYAMLEGILEQQVKVEKEIDVCATLYTRLTETIDKAVVDKVIKLLASDEYALVYGAARDILEDINDDIIEKAYEQGEENA